MASSCFDGPVASGPAASGRGLGGRRSAPRTDRCSDIRRGSTPVGYWTRCRSAGCCRCTPPAWTGSDAELRGATT